MDWIILIIATAIFYGAYNFFIKVSSGHINQIVGAVILQVVAALLGGAVLLTMKTINKPLDLGASQKGILFAVLAGISVGLAEIASFYVFSKGAPASIGIPIIVGGSVIVGTIFGLIFLKENLALIHYLAIVLIIIGIAILSSR